MSTTLTPPDSRPEATAPFCQSPDDLYGFEARYVIGRLLRKFCDEYQLTPFELLHSWGGIKKLEDEYGQMAAAVHRVGLFQAKNEGIEVNERVRSLQRVVDVTMARIRDYSEIRRRLPRLDPDDLDRSVMRLKKALRDGDVHYAFAVQLAYGMTGTGSVLQKLHTVLGFLKSQNVLQYIRQIDRFIADAVGFPDVLIELVGPQRHRAGMIRTLAKTVSDQQLAAAAPNPMLAQIGMLVHGDALPETRKMLLRWMIRELNHEGPLNPHDESQEQELLDQLIPVLRDARGGVIGGEETDIAVNMRKMRARQRQLRSMGLHDVAQDLPDSWQFTSIARAPSAAVHA